jgi:hypothetical protein
MEKIYLDNVNGSLATKEITLNDFYNYIEGLFKESQTICIYENIFSKNASVCFKSHKEFTDFWDTLEADKKSLSDKIKAFKEKPKEVKTEE